MLKQVFSDTINGVRIVIAKGADEFIGMAYPTGKDAIRIADGDFDRLKAALQFEAGKLHPDYVGFAGAKKRFLSFFPDGFADPAYREWERDYKDEVTQFLREKLPLEHALSADRDDAIVARKAFGKNLLSSYENARIHQVLGSDSGPAFIRAAAAFACSESGDQGALTDMARGIEPYGRPSWPPVSYLPYFWKPDTHVFLKPEATKDFASRVGSNFQNEYAADLNVGVYRSLLKLAAETTAKHINEGAIDGIDCQSFIWVVGAYTDADLNRIEAWRQQHVQKN